MSCSVCEINTGYYRLVNINSLCNLYAAANIVSARQMAVSLALKIVVGRAGSVGGAAYRVGLLRLRLHCLSVAIGG